MDLGTTYQYRDSDGTIITANKTPEMLAADSDFRSSLATNADFIAMQRSDRDNLLKECDWTQGEDVPSSIKTAYQTYRSALRNLPNHANWPLLNASDWPTKPEV